MKQSGRNAGAEFAVVGSAHVLQSETHTGAVSTGDATGLTGIEALLAGEGYISSNEIPEVMAYMSSLDILESSKEM